MSPYLAAALVIGCIAAGWAAGLVADQRLLGGRGASGRRGDRTGLTDAVAFIGGAFGIILGLLLVFAVQHFADTRELARQEASSSVALFNAASPYPAADRQDVRRSTICYMRAIAADDWEASRSVDLTGSENVAAWSNRIQQRVDAVPLDSKVRKSTHFFLVDNSLQLDAERTIRLQLALPEIPIAIWLVIFICTFAFITLMTIHLGPRRRLRIITNLTAGTVLVAIVATLASLDEPYTGTTATVSPVAMESALLALQDAYPEEDWSPCPRLAQDTVDPVR